MNRVKVLFFATFRDYAGARQAELELPEGVLVRDLRRILGEKYPQLAQPVKTALIALDKEYAFDEDPVKMGAEVGVFAPVSGGGSPRGPPISAANAEQGAN